MMIKRIPIKHLGNQVLRNSFFRQLSSSRQNHIARLASKSIALGEHEIQSFSDEHSFTEYPLCIRGRESSSTQCPRGSSDSVKRDKDVSGRRQVYSLILHVGKPKSRENKWFPTDRKQVAMVF